jgi:hypothetical protein
LVSLNPLLVVAVVHAILINISVCDVSTLHFFLVPPPPIIKFTQLIYRAPESGNAVVGIFVASGKVTAPVTVR